MTDSLADKNRGKQASLANIRQKLITPVTTIVGYSELLYEEATEKNLAGMLPDLDRVLGAARGLFNIVDRLLGLTGFWPRIVGITGIIVLLIGALTLIEYIFGVDLHIDQFVHGILY